MKKLLLYAASLATIAFTGCSKEQSELSISDVKAKATISGKVTYDAGKYWNKTENKEISEEGIGSDVTVVVKINNKDYQGEDGTYQYFETQTDSKGMFSIDVPVYNAITNAEVYNLPFYGKWQEYEYNSDKGDYVNKEYTDVLMKITKVNVSANEKDVKFVTISTSYENQDQFKD